MANRRRASAGAEEIESEKWGVPDWRSSEGYPLKWSVLASHERRWEFLRRDKNYRADWERSQKERTQLGVAKYTLKIFRDPKQDWKSLPKKFRFYRNTPPSDPVLSGGHIVAPHAFVGITGITNKKTVAENSSLTTEQKELLEAVYQHRQTEEQIERIFQEIIPRNLYEGRVWIEFNLDFPPDAQLKRAKKCLQEAAEETQKYMDSLAAPEPIDPDGFIFSEAPYDVFTGKRRVLNKQSKQAPDIDYGVLMLRVCDALNCGRTNGEIAKGLGDCFPDSLNESTISKYKKRIQGCWRIL